MDLDIIECTIGLGEFICVARITIRMTIGVWGTAIREKVHDLMSRLLMGREIIPEHGSILKVGLWVALLGMDKLSQSA